MFPRLGASGAPVGDAECPAEVSRHLSSVMTYQVHGQDAGDIEWRVHACLHGNPATQRGAPGMTESVQAIRPPLPHEEPSDCGRTHLEEKLPCLIIQMEMPMCREVLHEEQHASCSTRSIHRNHSASPTSLPSLPSDTPVP